MPTDFLGRVMVVFNRYGMSMLQGAGVSLKDRFSRYAGRMPHRLCRRYCPDIPSEKGDNPLKKGSFVDHTADLKCLCGIFQGYTYDGPGYVYLLWPYAFAGN